MMSMAKFALVLFLILCVGNAAAQSVEKEHVAVVELGGAAFENIKDGTSTNSVSVEAMADFMFWRSEKHKFGWYVEPTYEYNFGRGREQSLGVTGGLLISLP